MTQDGAVVLITGASSGFGAAIAQELAAEGYRVFGTSRRTATEPTAKGGGVPGAPGEITMLRLDVCEDESARACVDAVLGITGRIDALINNAGYSLAGAVEETSMDEAIVQFQTNFFGPVRMMKAVLPSMRERGEGKIINVSSLAALVGVPYHGFYSASKSALTGLSEATRLEVRRFGVHVSVIEPSDFKTESTANRIMVADGIGEYAEDRDRAVNVMAESEQSGPPPKALADLVVKILRTPRPRFRYRVGFDAKWVPVAKGLLPAAAYELAIRQNYKMTNET